LIGELLLKTLYDGLCYDLREIMSKSLEALTVAHEGLDLHREANHRRAMNPIDVFELAKGKEKRRTCQRFARRLPLKRAELLLNESESID